MLEGVVSRKTLKCFRLRFNEILCARNNSPLILSQTNPCFYVFAENFFENYVGKGEIARNEQFLLFPTVFFTHLENFLRFPLTLKLSSANSFNLKEYKICRLGKG